MTLTICLQRLFRKLLRRMAEKLKTIPDYYQNHPPELLKEVKNLNQQIQENRRQLYASILLCPACFHSDKDMTYNPVRKEWYCTECYAKLQKKFSEEAP